MDRPNGVHEAAEWRRNQKVWKWVNRNSENEVTEIKVWRTDGSLKAHTERNFDTQESLTRRFHNNGDLAAQIRGRMNDLLNPRISQESFRATSFSDEPGPCPDLYISKSVTTFPDRYKQETQFFDLEGNLIQGDEEFFKRAREFKERYYDFSEYSPKKKISKLNQFIDKIIELVPEKKQKLEDSFRPVFIEKISESDIADAEKRLGIEFPVSYKTFLEENGLFKLGKKSGYKARFIHPSKIRSLEETLTTDWFFDWTDKSELRKTLKKVYMVAFSDDNLDQVWGYALDYNCLNSESGFVEPKFFNPKDLSVFEEASSPADRDGFLRMFNYMIQNEYKFIAENELKFVADFL